VLADPDARISACRRLLEDPSARINAPEVYNTREVAKVRKGDLDSAVKDFTSAVDLNPNYVGAIKNRGIARHMQGDYNTAIADFNRAPPPRSQVTRSLQRERGAARQKSHFARRRLALRSVARP
jgi:tetratricopeptide (TPR) repeat protein